MPAGLWLPGDPPLPDAPTEEPIERPGRPGLWLPGDVEDGAPAAADDAPAEDGDLESETVVAATIREIAALKALHVAVDRTAGAAAASRRSRACRPTSSTAS